MLDRLRNQTTAFGPEGSHIRPLYWRPGTVNLGRCCWKIRGSGRKEQATKCLLWYLSKSRGPTQLAQSPRSAQWPCSIRTDQRAFLPRLISCSQNHSNQANLLVQILLPRPQNPLQQIPITYSQLYRGMLPQGVLAHGQIGLDLEVLRDTLELAITSEGFSIAAWQCIYNKLIRNISCPFHCNCAIIE